jgi:hypothetical protein
MGSPAMMDSTRTADSGMRPSQFLGHLREDLRLDRDEHHASPLPTLEA